MQRLLPLVTLTIVLVLTGCGRDDQNIALDDDDRLVIGQAEVEETSVRGVNPGTRTLVLNGFTGNITLAGTADANARLEFTKRARGSDDANARSLLPDIEIEEAGGDESYTFTLRSRSPERSAVDVSGTVPTGTPLRIELQSGTIEVSALDGPLDLRTEHGSIRVAGAGRPLSLETRNGDIELGMRLVSADGDHTIQTSNGDITITLPASASARIDAGTSAGDIRTSGLSFTNRRLERQGAGTRFRAQLGQGNAAVSLRTENGSITLNEGRVMTLVPSDTLVGTPSDAVEGDTTLDATTAPPDTLREADEAAQDTSVLQQPLP